MSADGRFGVVVIAFVGSVFSPYYYSARKKNGAADPRAYPAINVALFGPHHNRWVFTERHRTALVQSETTLLIGDNTVRRDAGEIRIDINDRTALGRHRVEGTVRLFADRFLSHPYVIDRNGRHRWWPIAPVARIEVDFRSPQITFKGSGYADANDGDEPLERSLVSWTWSRAALESGAAVFYDCLDRDNGATGLALRFDADQQVSQLSPPGMVSLPETRLWGCPRSTRSEGPARIIRTLENSPFYARSIVETTIEGRAARGIHESLRLDRFAHPLMQRMLPFRIRRAR